MKPILAKSITFLSVAVTLLITAAVTLTPTYAAGEQYSWGTNGSLQITGGNLVSPVTIPAPKIGLGNQSTTQYSSTISVRNGQTPCELTLTVSVGTNFNTGAVFAKTPPPAVSKPGTAVTPPCPQNIIAQYNNTTVTISGNRNGAAETDAQKTVRLVINTPNGAAAPASLTIKVGTQSKTVTKTIDENGTGVYETSFLVEPGTWQVCAPPVLATCASLLKEKYIPKIVSYGEFATSVTVDLTVTIAGYTSQSCNIGPYDIVLKKNGAIVQTVKSDSQTTQPPKGSENTLGTDAMDITAYLHAKLTKVAPDDYEVCAPAFNACQSITKDGWGLGPLVKLTGHESDSASRCLAPGEPSDPPLPAVPPPPCAPGKTNNGVCTAFMTAFGEINTDAGSFVVRIFAVLLAISGGLAVLLVMRAGYIIMTSAGNGERVKKGREQLVAAIVGLLFIIFSFVILEVIGIQILNIPGFSGVEVAPGGTCQVGGNQCSSGYTCNYNNGTGQCVKDTTP